MKLATYRHRDERHLGIVDSANRCLYQATACVPGGPDDIIEWIKRFGTESPSVSLRDAEPLPLNGVTLEAPIPHPGRNVICVGKNYLAHANEFSRSGFDRSDTSKSGDAPQAPIVFTKAPSSVIGPGQPIVYPTGVSEKVDYEAEVGVVIGRGGRGIRAADAYRHVFGYVIINDVTARDLQASHRQWFIGKSIDSFCPMGPWLVTPDEIDPENLNVRCWVNDELRQDANTRDLIFDVPTLIAVLSAGITLVPGDIIATGTPQGVGIGFDPPRFLKPGDRVRITVDGLGELINEVSSARANADAAGQQ